MKSRSRLHEAGYFVGGDPGDPKVGDLKIILNVLRPGEVSVVAKQAGHSFQPYLTQAGTELVMIEAGSVPADLMFKHEEEANVMLTWILRLVGLVMMTAGICLVFKPLRTVADVLPMLGDLLGMGVGIFALALALPLTLITIAVAWLFYRPLWGILLIAAAVAVFILIKVAGKGRKKAPA